MKKLFLALAITAMSIPAFAGTWSAPTSVSNEIIYPPVTVASYTASAGVTSTTAMSGSCVTGSTHYFYSTSLVPRGIVKLWSVEIKKQTCV